MKRRVLGIALVAVILAVFGPTPALAGTPSVDNILTMFSGMSDQIFSDAAGTAWRLAYGLATIEIVWFVFQTLINKRSIEDLIGAFSTKIIGIMFALSLIYSMSSAGGYQGAHLIKQIITVAFANAGATYGNSAGGNVTTGDPDSFITQGVTTSSTMALSAIAIPAAIAVPLIEADSAVAAATATAEGNPYTPGMGIGSLIEFQGQLASMAVPIIIIGTLILVVLSACISVLMSFVRLAVQLFLVTIETYVVLAASTFLLGFSTSRWTQSIAQPYQRYIMTLAFRTFAIYLVAGISIGIVQAVGEINFASSLDPITLIPSLLTNALNVVVVAIIVTQLLNAPDQIANALMGYQSTGLGGGAMQQMSRFASTAVAAASGGHSAAMHAMGGASGSGAAGGTHGAGTQFNPGSKTPPTHPASTTKPGQETKLQSPPAQNSGGGSNGAQGTNSPASPASPPSSASAASPAADGLSRLKQIAHATLDGAAGAAFQHAFGIDPFAGTVGDGGSSSTPSALSNGGSGGNEGQVRAAQLANATEAFMNGNDGGNNSDITPAAMQQSSSRGMPPIGPPKMTVPAPPKSNN